MSQTPPGGLSPDVQASIGYSLAETCQLLCSQYVFSEYNNAKRTQANKLVTHKTTPSVPLRAAPTNLPSPIVFAAPTAPIPVTCATNDNENANMSISPRSRPSSPKRPASPSKRDESGDIRMASPSPDRSGRASPTRRNYRSMSPVRQVVVPPAAVLDPVETPLTQTRPFPSPTSTRSYSASHIPPTLSPRRAIAMSSPTHVHRPPLRSPTAPQASAVKTSLTHPMHVSSMLPLDLLARVSASAFSVPRREASENWHILQQPLSIADKTGFRLIGNLFLSSCPGKKVRLTGPILPGGRSAICRDLKLDLQRVSSEPFNAKVVICCLDNVELEYLGVPWQDYELAAKELGLRIVRIPLLEGFAPENVTEIDALVGQLIKDHTLKGESVLVHCRGGVGRAGSIAVCWYAKMGLAGRLQEEPVGQVVKNAVKWIRERRSTKAIETPVQVLFVHNYISYLANHCRPIAAQQLVAN